MSSTTTRKPLAIGNGPDALEVATDGMACYAWASPDNIRNVCHYDAAGPHDGFTQRVAICRVPDPRPAKRTKRRARA